MPDDAKKEAVLIDDENSLAEITPGALAKAEWITERDNLIASIKSVLKVDNQDEFKVSGKLQAMAKKMVKGLSTMRLDLTRPLDKRKKEITDKEKELLKPINAQLGRIKAMNDSYATLVAAKAEKERQRIEKEARDKANEAMAAQQQQIDEAKAMFGDDVEMMPEEIDIEQVPVDLPTGKVTSTDNRTVTRWKFRVDDSAKVPREFCTVDEKKIRAYMNSQKAMGKDPVVPGVVFEKFVSVESKG